MVKLLWNLMIIYDWLDFIAISPYSIKLEMILIGFNLNEYGEITMKSYNIIYDWLDFIAISSYSIELNLIEIILN